MIMAGSSATALKILTGQGWNKVLMGQFLPHPLQLMLVCKARGFWAL